MSLPFFPLYPDDFEADTAHLSLAEDGAYNRLLRLCWRTVGCSLPSDRAWIYRRMRAFSDAEKEVVEAVLTEFFKERGGRISNPRLTKEWAKTHEAHERRKNAGSKGGKAKSLKTNENTASNATAMEKQPEPEPEPYKSLSSESDVAREKRKAARKPSAVKPHSIPKDWWPSQEGIDAAREHGIADVTDQVEKFRNHYLGGTIKRDDWNHLFANWCSRAFNGSGPKAASGGGGKPAQVQHDRTDPALAQIFRLTRA